MDLTTNNSQQNPNTNSGDTTNDDNAVAGLVDAAKIESAEVNAEKDHEMLSGKGITGPEPVVQKGQVETDMGDGIILRKGPSIDGGEQPSEVMQTTEISQTIPMPKTVNAMRAEAEAKSTTNLDAGVISTNQPGTINQQPTGEASTNNLPPVENQQVAVAQTPPQPRVTNELPPLKVEEKEVVRSRGGGFSIIKSIRRLGCLILLLLVVFIVGLVVTVIFRPPLTWDPVKNFLNAGFSPEFVEEYTSDQTIDIINSSITSSGETTLKLNESQVTALIRGTISSNETVVEFEQNIMRIVTDVDSTKDIPLWLIIQFDEETENSLSISKIGFERVGLPEGINKFVNSFVLNFVNLSQGDLSGGQSPESLITALISTSIDKDIEILDVKFNKDEIEIRYGIK